MRIRALPGGRVTTTHLFDTVGAGAIGGVIGAATFGRVERRLGLGRAVVFASFAFPLTMLLYPAARGSTLVAAVLLGAGEFLTAIAVPWLDISIGECSPRRSLISCVPVSRAHTGLSSTAYDHLAQCSEDCWAPRSVCGTFCG
jgi:hypothetical protein